MLTIWPCRQIIEHRLNCNTDENAYLLCVASSLISRCHWSTCSTYNHLKLLTLSTPRPRTPAVSGRFYPGDPIELASQVRTLMPPSTTPQTACGVVAPHAGYVYSGKVAAEVFGAIAVPTRVVILCPNHTGVGPAISVYSDGAFAIPGATISVDTTLTTAIMKRCRNAVADRSAHAREHAIEVELPFLLARQPSLTITPIVLGALSATDAIAFGHALSDVQRELDQDMLVVASSDMSHYLPEAETRRADKQALAPLLALDPSGLYQTVTANRISMCGYVPTTVMLSYAQQQKAAAAELVAYTTSGAAFGDYQRVVGYAGVVVT